MYCEGVQTLVENSGLCLQTTYRSIVVYGGSRCRRVGADEIMYRPWFMAFMGFIWPSEAVLVGPETGPSILGLCL